MELTALNLLFLAACLLFGMTASVVVRHVRSWRADPMHRLLPLHIWAVALSYDLFLLAAIITTRVAEPLPWWRWALLVPAIVLGMVAMYIIGRHQTRR